MSGCTCQRYEIPAPDGSVLEGELVRDPDCRQHGFPTTGWPMHNREGWPAGHPLRRHARRVVVRAAYQPRDWRGRFLTKTQEHTRLETPRETEARLYAESLPPKPRRRAAKPSKEPTSSDATS